MNPDPALRKLLRDTPADVPLPARFNAEVWRRIAERQAAPSWLGRIAAWADGLMLLRHPIAVPAAIAVALLVGGLWGAQDGRQSYGAMLAASREAYVRSVDPLAQVAGLP